MKKILFFILFSYLYLNANACGITGYGVCSGSFGIDEAYSVYVEANPELTGYCQECNTQYSAYISDGDFSISLSTGDDLTMMAWDCYTTEETDFGGSLEVMVDATWTVGYDCVQNFSVYGGINGGKGGPPKDGIDGFNFSYEYNFTASNSSNTYFYCNVPYPENDLN